MTKSLSTLIIEMEHSKHNDHASGHHFRNFAKIDHQTYGGACALPNGEPPKIHQSEEHGHEVIVSGDEDGNYHVEAHHSVGADGDHNAHSQTFKHRHHAMEFAHKAAEILHKHGTAETDGSKELEHHGFEKII